VAPFIPGLLEKSGWVLTLQNGLGNAEILAERVEKNSIVLGPCTYGARLDSQGTVCAAGDGELLLGPFRKERDLGPLEALFQHAGFRTLLREDPLPLLWEKLVYNAAINPLSALVRCSNGDLLASEDLRKIMENLVRETLEVARGEGVMLNQEECLEKCFSICRKTGSNRSSMLQDVEAGRPTENDAISGQVVLRGRRRGIPVPCTENLWGLLRGIDFLAESQRRL
jgi:2-dehydropantoate 2-reductase